MNMSTYNQMSSALKLGDESIEEENNCSNEAKDINVKDKVVRIGLEPKTCLNDVDLQKTNKNKNDVSSTFSKKPEKNDTCSQIELQSSSEADKISFDEFQGLIQSQNTSSDEPERKRLRKRSLPSKVVKSSESLPTEKSPRYLTHDQRMKIIELCQQENAPSKRGVARMFNVSDATIRKTLLKKNDILKLDKKICSEKSDTKIENDTNNNNFNNLEKVYKLTKNNLDTSSSSVEQPFTVSISANSQQTLSLGQKLEVVSLLISSKPQAEVASQFDVTEEYINKIWMQRQEILITASKKLTNVYVDEETKLFTNDNVLDSINEQPTEKLNNDSLPTLGVQPLALPSPIENFNTEPIISLGQPLPLPSAIEKFSIEQFPSHVCNTSLNFTPPQTPDLNKPQAKPNYSRLTIAQKLQIIKILCEPSEGKKLSMRKVGKMFGVTDGSIRKVMKDKDMIIANSKLVDDEFKNTRTKFTPAKDPVVERIEEELYTWIVQMRLQNFPVSPTAAIQRAKSLASELNCNEFKASWNWFKRYRDRRHMRLVPLLADGTDLRIIMDIRDACNRENPNSENNFAEDKRFNNKLPKMKLLVRGVDFD